MTLLRDALTEPPASAPRVVPLCDAFTVTVVEPSPQTRLHFLSLPPLDAGVAEARAIVLGWDGLTPATLLHTLRLPMNRAGREALERDVAKTGGVVPYFPRTAAMLWVYSPVFRRMVLDAMRDAT